MQVAALELSAPGVPPPASTVTLTQSKHGTLPAGAVVRYTATLLSPHNVSTAMNSCINYMNEELPTDVLSAKVNCCISERPESP